MRRFAVVVGTLTALATCARSQTERIYEFAIEGKRIGFSRYTRARTPRGIRTASDTTIKVSLLGASFDMQYKGDALHALEGRRLISYKLDFTRGDQSTRVECSIEGRSLRTSVTTAGKSSRKTLNWGDGFYLVEGNSMDTWNAMFAAMGARIPAKVQAFAPLGGSMQTLLLARPGIETLTVLGKRRICDRIRIGKGAEEVMLLVDRAAHEVVEMRVPAQKAVCRLSDASALTSISTYDPGSKLFCPVSAPLPDYDKLESLKVKARIEIAGEKVTAALLQSPFQAFTGRAAGALLDGTFELKPFTYDGSSSPRIADAPPKDPRLAPFLKPEPNVESDDPEIRALAKKLIDGAATTWEAVRRIDGWLKANVTYAITGSGALECLRARKGDCGPHAWLTIALCRAAGIPARITGGVLYSRALGGSFGQHYWTRVWMGKAGWVPIDTTTHEVGRLSPAHITLWNLGGLQSLKVEVLDFAPKPTQTGADPLVGLRRAYRPSAGAKELWVFTSGSDEIARQTAECITVTDDGPRAFSDWRYEFSATPRPPASATTISGVLSLWTDATPRKLSFEARAGGGTQTGTYTFAADAVEVDVAVGETKVQRSVPLQRGCLLQMNNLLTAFRLVTRSLGLKPGESRTEPFFAASTMQTLDMTFRAAKELRSVKINGTARTCLVCDVEPIKNTFFLDTESGELLRVEASAGQLVIERR